MRVDQLITITVGVANTGLVTTALHASKGLRPLNSGIPPSKEAAGCFGFSYCFCFVFCLFGILMTELSGHHHYQNIRKGLEQKTEAECSTPVQRAVENRNVAGQGLLTSCAHPIASLFLLQLYPSPWPGEVGRLVGPQQTLSAKGCKRYTRCLS